MTTDTTPLSHSWPKRIGWFIMIWVVSVSALGIVALAFRLIMAAAGMTRSISP